MYLRTVQRWTELLETKAEQDEAMAQSNLYFEKGIDYLKRMIQVVDLEFKIKQENKGSASYLYGYGSGYIGIGKDSKDYSTVNNIDSSITTNLLESIVLQIERSLV